MNNLFWNRTIFEGISDESKISIEKMNKKESSYNANELVIAEGEEISYICIILEGCLKSTEYTSSGKALNSSYYFGGDAFPFYLVYSGIKKYFFNTYALKKSKVVWLPVDELKPIIDKDHKFLHNILRFVSEYCTYSKITMRGTQYRKIVERLAYWMLNINNPNDYIKIPNSQEVLADILHVNRSSLNQELKKLKENKIISIENKKIKILNLKYLEDLL